MVVDDDQDVGTSLNGNRGRGKRKEVKTKARANRGTHSQPNRAERGEKGGRGVQRAEGEPWLGYGRRGMSEGKEDSQAKAKAKAG